MAQDLPAVNVEHLEFSYGGPSILRDVSLNLPIGSRTLLVGSNGAGKTTLLRILAGKRMVKTKTVDILGRHAYFDTPATITYLGPEWMANPVVRRDVSVSSLLESMSSDSVPASRREHLIDILDINPDWHMHEVSDGERRRVQILLGLLQPFEVLLLDEVTVDLDVVVRRNLLEFLRLQTTESNVTADGTKLRPATIIYATHIFDGLGEWPTHISHIRNGTVDETMEYDKIEDIVQARSGKIARSSVMDSPLLLLVEKWLKKDFAEARRLRNEIAKAETKWDKLGSDEAAKTHGDKYYNYWSGPKQ